MSKIRFGSGCLLMALVTPMATGCRTAATGRTEPATWELVVDEDFTEAASVDGWILDGSAAVSVTTEGELLVQTLPETPDGQAARCSVLWYPTPVWGDVRYEFDARAEMGSRCIFFFNARPLTGHRSIFEWERPLAKYVDYAGEERMELYTLGMLRYDQEEENLRAVGGELATWLKEMEALPRGPERKRRDEAFQRKTIFCAFPHAAESPDKMARHVLTVEGARLTLDVDGRRIFDIVDADRVANPWPGGYFGFRNFRPTKAWYDNLRVYRRTGSAPK